VAQRDGLVFAGHSPSKANDAAPESWNNPEDQGETRWVGGNEKVDGRTPTREAVAERVSLIRRAIDTLFADRTEFDACWTYITCCVR